MKLLSNCIGLALALACTAAAAQVHVAERGAFTLRANAIPSEQVPASSAGQHGIERAADRGVLNVVVVERRDGRDRSVPARVNVIRQNLLGQKEAIEMRQVNENGGVSYIGSFKFGPLKNLRFAVTATPAGSTEPLTVEFEDRFVARYR